jgi:predicted XRE-type DNA-binding protein
MKKSVEKSSGNIFADMGLANAEQELFKAKLTLQIHRIIKARKLTQVAAANLLGTTQPQVSSLMRLRPTSLSVGRLMEFLTILGQDIEVTLKPAPKKRAGHMVVKVAA